MGIGRAEIDGPIPHDVGYTLAMSFRGILGSALITLTAFAVALVGLAPWGLIANRYIFPRLEKRAGIQLEAGSVVPGFPCSLLFSDVTLRTPAARQPVESLRVTPGFSWLLGKRAAAIEAELAGGTLEIEWRDDAVSFAGSGLDLKKLILLRAVTPWKLEGRASIDGSIEAHAEKPPTGGVSWTFEEATADGVGLPGLELPLLDLGRFEGELKIADNRVEFSRGRASGGENGLEITGGVTLAKPASNSAVGLHLALTPSPAFIAGLGAKARIIERIRKPDGTIRIAVEGTLSAPRTGLE
jgi:type II secretion system protein N